LGVTHKIIIKFLGTKAL